MTLGLKPGENLVNNRKIDTASYADYLHAKALAESRNAENRVLADTLLQRVTAGNPEFAPGWAELALLRYTQGLFVPLDRAKQLRDEGEAAARRAVQLDPGLAGAYESLGLYASTRGHMLEADNLYSKAVSLDPLNAELLDSYAVRLGIAGHVQEALKLLETAYSVDPFSPVPAPRLVDVRWLNGHDEDAIALAKTLAPLQSAVPLTRIYASEGRFAEAADAVGVGKDARPAEIRSISDQVAQLLRAIATRQSPPEKLPVFPAAVEFVYLYAGAPQRVLDDYQRRADANYFGGVQSAYVWHPSYSVVRKTAQFKELMRKAGMPDFWRAKGWPPQCHPTTGGDFECS